MYWNILLTIIIYCLHTYALKQCPKICKCTPESVNCQGRHLTSIPSPLHPELRSLDIRDASLNRKLRNSSLSGLVELQHLYLIKCKIRKLPQRLFTPTPLLIMLSLMGNRLTHLPNDLLTPCRSLQVLDLSDNRLTSIRDRSLGKLRNLRTLSLAGNPLKIVQLPSSIGHAPALQTLDLSRNPTLTNLGEFWFSGSESSLPNNRVAVMLNFSECSLDTIDKKAFHGVIVKGIVLNANRMLNINEMIQSMDSNYMKILHISRFGTQSEGR